MAADAAGARYVNRLLRRLADLEKLIIEPYKTRRAQIGASVAWRPHENVKVVLARCEGVGFQAAAARASVKALRLLGCFSHPSPNPSSPVHCSLLEGGAAKTLEAVRKIFSIENDCVSRTLSLCDKLDVALELSVSDTAAALSTADKGRHTARVLKCEVSIRKDWDAIPTFTLVDEVTVSEDSAGNGSSLVAMLEEGCDAARHRITRTDEIAAEEQLGQLFMWCQSAEPEMYAEHKLEFRQASRGVQCTLKSIDSFGNVRSFRSPDFLNRAQAIRHVTDQFSMRLPSSGVLARQRPLLDRMAWDLDACEVDSARQIDCTVPDDLVVDVGSLHPLRVVKLLRSGVLQCSVPLSDRNVGLLEGWRQCYLTHARSNNFDAFIDSYNSPPIGALPPCSIPTQSFTSLFRHVASAYVGRVKVHRDRANSVTMTASSNLIDGTIVVGSSSSPLELFRDNFPDLLAHWNFRKQEEEALAAARVGCDEPQPREVAEMPEHHHDQHIVVNDYVLMASAVMEASMHYLSPTGDFLPTVKIQQRRVDSVIESTVSVQWGPKIVDEETDALVGPLGILFRIIEKRYAAHFHNDGGSGTAHASFPLALFPSFTHLCLTWFDTAPSSTVLADGLELQLDTAAFLHKRPRSDHHVEQQQISSSEKVKEASVAASSAHRNTNSSTERISLARVQLSSQNVSFTFARNLLNHRAMQWNFGAESATTSERQLRQGSATPTIPEISTDPSSLMTSLAHAKPKKPQRVPHSSQKRPISSEISLMRALLDTHWCAEGGGKSSLHIDSDVDQFGCAEHTVTVSYLLRGTTNRKSIIKRGRAIVLLLRECFHDAIRDAWDTALEQGLSDYLTKWPTWDSLQFDIEQAVPVFPFSRSPRYSPLSYAPLKVVEMLQRPLFDDFKVDQQVVQGNGTVEVRIVFRASIDGQSVALGFGVAPNRVAAVNLAAETAISDNWPHIPAVLNAMQQAMAHKLSMTLYVDNEAMLFEASASGNLIEATSATASTKAEAYVIAVEACVKKSGAPAAPANPSQVLPSVAAKPSGKFSAQSTFVDMLCATAGQILGIGAHARILVREDASAWHVSVMCTTLGLRGKRELQIMRSGEQEHLDGSKLLVAAIGSLHDEIVAIGRSDSQHDNSSGGFDDASLTRELHATLQNRVSVHLNLINAVLQQRSISSLDRLRKFLSLVFGVDAIVDRELTSAKQTPPVWKVSIRLSAAPASFTWHEGTPASTAQQQRVIVLGVLQDRSAKVALEELVKRIFSEFADALKISAPVSSTRQQELMSREPSRSNVPLISAITELIIENSKANPRGQQFTSVYHTVSPAAKTVTVLGVTASGGEHLQLHQGAYGDAAVLPRVLLQAYVAAADSSSGVELFRRSVKSQLQQFLESSPGLSVQSRNVELLTNSLFQRFFPAQDDGSSVLVVDDDFSRGVWSCSAELHSGGAQVVLSCVSRARRVDARKNTIANVVRENFPEWFDAFACSIDTATHCAHPTKVHCASKELSWLLQWSEGAAKSPLRRSAATPRDTAAGTVVQRREAAMRVPHPTPPPPLSHQPVVRVPPRSLSRQPRPQQ